MLAHLSPSGPLMCKISQEKNKRHTHTHRERGLPRFWCVFWVCDGAVGSGSGAQPADQHRNTNSHAVNDFTRSRCPYEDSFVSNIMCWIKCKHAVLTSFCERTGDKYISISPPSCRTITSLRPLAVKYEEYED